MWIRNKGNYKNLRLKNTLNIKGEVLWRSRVSPSDNSRRKKSGPEVKEISGQEISFPGGGEKPSAKGERGFGDGLTLKRSEKKSLGGAMGKTYSIWLAREEWGEARPKEGCGKNTWEIENDGQGQSRKGIGKVWGGRVMSRKVVKSQAIKGLWVQSARDSSWTPDKNLKGTPQSRSLRRKGAHKERFSFLKHLRTCRARDTKERQENLEKFRKEK